MSRRTYTYKDGSKYDGEWKGKKRHGYGLWVRSDGYRFEGYWENDKPNGYGSLTFPDGRMQTGQWKDGNFIAEAKPAIIEADLINRFKKENQELKNEIALLKKQMAESQELAHQAKPIPVQDYQTSQAKKVNTRETKPTRKDSKKLWVFTIIAIALLLAVVAIYNGEENQLTGPYDSVEFMDEEAVLEFEDKPGDTSNDLVEDESSANKTEDNSTADNQNRGTTGQVEVHFIDVGQGDSIYIKTPTQNILIDGGNRGDTALNYLRNQGVSSLDLVIGTHPHADHIGGLINVMQAIPTKEVIDPAVVNETLTFEDYLRLIDQKDIMFTEGRAGITRELCSGIVMNIIHPNNPLASDPNNASIVAKLTFGEISFLFTGDAEREAEREMLHGRHDLNATVLKVGHHGSRTSTTQAFLDAVAPQAAVIMCGRNNQYGHPHDETLLSLLGSNVDIYRTDLQGSIVIVTDGREYTVNKQPFSYSQNQRPPPPDKVNINTACKEELQRIIHIGPARAEAIIKLRPFNSVDDLTRVSGIAEVRLRDIKNQGIACVD